MLRVQNLSLKAGSTVLVQDVCLELKSGESLALMGPSGSGKSLTAMAVAGLLPHSVVPVKGSVQGQNVALIMQNPADCFDPLFTLAWVFQESFCNTVPKEALADFIQDLLHKVGFAQPQSILAAYPFELSGGMLHRCMIALALGAILCGRASCVVADEPLSGLDSPSRLRILHLLRQLQGQYGFALLYIDHDITSAAQVAKRIAIMDSGRIVEQGKLKDVLENPQHAVTQAMVQAYGRLQSFCTDSCPSSNAGQQDIVLDVQKISKKYGQKTVLQDISLQIQRGQSVGLVGANGAGKSTLIRLLLGLEAADEGKAFCLGRPIIAYGSQGSHGTHSSKAAWRKDLQAVFQHARLAVNPRMQGRDILLEPIHAHRCVAPFDTIMASKAAQDAKVAELLALVELPAFFAKKYPSHMSGGQLQRLCLARALALQPQIVLLDESLADLDAAVAEQLQNLLQKLKKQLGISFLYISHDMNAVLRLCDTIAVLHEGRIVETFAAINAQEAQRHPAFKALLPA